MKRLGILAASLLIILGGFWLTKSRHSGSNNPDYAKQEFETATRNPRVGAVHLQEPETPAPDPEPEPEPELPPPATPPPKAISVASVEEVPSGPELNEPNSGLTPATVLENMRAVFRQYYLRFHENPVGNNAEITELLNGANPKQVVFLQQEDGIRVNAHGELIDNWGTPFFFHSMSRSEMEIRSAGPDKKLWTVDDLVMK